MESSLTRSLIGPIDPPTEIRVTNPDDLAQNIYVASTILACLEVAGRVVIGAASQPIIETAAVIRSMEGGITPDHTLIDRLQNTAVRTIAFGTGNLRGLRDTLSFIGETLASAITPLLVE